MNWLSKKVEPEALPVNMTLDELLTDMERFGFPWICKMDNGWHSWIKVSVTPVGATFEIKSDFKMPSAIAAAQQCHTRLIQAVGELRKSLS